ncbi:MAG TPA: RNA polymerase factor sigma-54 [Alphaproteobacteria bacterium]|nr:RNA polymerase factor sigma-54 [Alphaproteobacteria bacterium]
MSLSQRLDLRQTQALVMTPQLQQAIKLLQMSSQELGSFIAEEIEKNPLLERAGDGPAPESTPENENAGERFVIAPSASAPAAVASSLAAPAVADARGAENQEDPWTGYGATEQYGRGGSFDEDDFNKAREVAEGPSLREYLLEQIHVDFADPSERLIAAALVELLDEAGYLPSDLELARAQLGATPEQFESVIVRLQQCDPPGIFARSLKECLAIQLREKNRLDPAMAALLDHLDLLAKHERARLMRLCGVDAEDLAGMIAEIRECDPKPATVFTADVAPPIVPDVMLRPQPGAGWLVELNNGNLPRVLANEHYYAEVQASVRSKSDKDYLSERWQQANWLVKALHQRATTILKVAAEIVRQQDKFFVHGVQHLKPLILRDIAEAVEMHESTVSRVTQHKYIATPRGLFELKYFFTTALARADGGAAVSSESVRERIKALVENEAAGAVLSDDRITEILRKDGIDIARRTVAKYREALRIPSSAQRRREKRGR